MDGEFVYAYEVKTCNNSNSTAIYTREASQGSIPGQDHSIANMNELDFLTMMVESRIFDISMIR